MFGLGLPGALVTSLSLAAVTAQARELVPVDFLTSAATVEGPTRWRVSAPRRPALVDQRLSLRPPRAARAWLAIGGLGMVGGAVLASVALSTHRVPRPLTTMLSSPGQSPLLAVGFGSLVAAYAIAKVGVVEAKRARAGGDPLAFFLRPQLSFADTGFHIGVAGRF